MKAIEEGTLAKRSDVFITSKDTLKQIISFNIDIQSDYSGLLNFDSTIVRRKYLKDNDRID